MQNNNTFLKQKISRKGNMVFQRSETHFSFCQALQQFLSANPGPSTSSGLLEAKKRWDLMESC